MDLSFNEQQRALQKTAREFLESNCPMTQVRELEESDLGYSTELWKQMADLQWLGITFPERYGGAEGGMLDLYVVYQAMGRTLTPSPHLACFVAGETLLRGGNDEQRQRALSAIAKGDLVISPALLEPSGVYGAEGIEMAAAQSNGGFRLNGTKLLVPYAHVAGYVLCAARTRRGDEPSDGITLFLVDANTAGLTIEPLKNIAGYKLFALTFDNVAVPDSAVVGTVDEGWAPLSEALDRAAVLQCAEIVGAAEAVLEMVVNYAKERVQFGRPIGQYQAVQYLCSDIAIDMHLTGLLSKQAAWRIDQGLPFQEEAAIANAYASKAVQHLVHQGQEVHAGVAFMLEHDMQMYTRRAKHWQLNLGDSRYHHEALAVAMEL